MEATSIERLNFKIKSNLNQCCWNWIEFNFCNLLTYDFALDSEMSTQLIASNNKSEVKERDKREKEMVKKVLLLIALKIAYLE